MKLLDNKVEPEIINIEDTSEDESEAEDKMPIPTNVVTTKNVYEKGKKKAACIEKEKKAQAKKVAAEAKKAEAVARKEHRKQEKAKKTELSKKKKLARSAPAPKTATNGEVCEKRIIHVEQ